MAIEPFIIDIPDKTLADLYTKLSLVRYPDNLLDATPWYYGTDTEYLQQLVHYWQYDYKWRKQEQILNQFAHFHTQIDGLKVHFIHERGEGTNPLPIILSHGWPSTFFDFYKVIPRLTHPSKFGGKKEDSFDVIVPSLPGFGFSGHPLYRGMSAWNIGKIWAKLMVNVLGYSKFGAHGGDWGAMVTARLGYSYPQHVLGIHLSWVPGSPYLGSESLPLSDAELEFQNKVTKWKQGEDAAYGFIQGTKPLTISYGLNDSPIGLAAWIIEKFHAWSDHANNLENIFTKDELLTTVMLYWVTETARSAAQIYYESFHPPLVFKAGEKITIPSSVACFPRDIYLPPREWAARILDNIQQWTIMPKGGHFPALEVPDYLTADIQQFFKSLR